MSNGGASSDIKGDSMPEQPKKTALWVGRVLSALPVLMLLMSASMKLSHNPKVVEMFVGHFGFAESSLMPIGILEIACTALYVIPRTAVLGAILLTAYLGGAVVTHLRVGDPFVIPILLGVSLWVGLYLREVRLQEITPLRKA
jgi:DoxX-like family